MEGCSRRHSPFAVLGAEFMYELSANTMSSALEVLGMSLPYSSSTPAMYPGMKMLIRIFTWTVALVSLREGAGMFQGCEVHEASP